MPGERLYNGIVLPDEWPPNRRELTRDPMPVPYLDDPPDVTPIDVGRQLFVDNFLIESTTLSRTFHKPSWHSASPVLTPDQPWESLAPGKARGRSAMPFSDGVWYDPADHLFKLWYYAGELATCYAQSSDGINWDKPQLDVVPETNIVMQHPGRRDSGSVWLDQTAPPGERFKMMCYDLTSCDHDIFLSADGIHWTKSIATGNAQDRSSLFYNPFRRKWCFSLRSTFFYNPARDEWCYSILSPASSGENGAWDHKRIRRYAEGDDLITAAHSWPRLGNPDWRNSAEGRDMAMIPTVWVGADRLDLTTRGSAYLTDMYHLDAVAYESVMVGLFSILREPGPPEYPKRTDKINNICVGFSRDGFHWDRPCREPILDVADDLSAWNASNMQSAGGCFLVVEDELFFFCSARGGSTDGQIMEFSTGLATLRRDGFASMDADATDAGGEPGSLTTRPLCFQGNQLFVNLVTGQQGRLTAEVLDRDGQVIPPFSRDNSLAVSGDHTSVAVQWKEVPDLSRLAGTPVRFRFFLQGGSLYAFWVSPDKTGASHGYIAAGGPGFSGPTDMEGEHDE